VPHPVATGSPARCARRIGAVRVRISAVEASRIPLEVEAPLGAPAFDDLARTLAGLGYEPRRAGGGAEGSPAGEGSPHIALSLREPIAPDAANVLLEQVSTWIRQRPAPKGRLRRKHPRPITVTISGPNGEVLFRAVVERT
jgi:hypothetical protein